jgi:hypothetical protein
MFIEWIKEPMSKNLMTHERECFIVGVCIVDCGILKDNCLIFCQAFCGVNAI